MQPSEKEKKRRSITTLPGGECDATTQPHQTSARLIAKQQPSQRPNRRFNTSPSGSLDSHPSLLLCARYRPRLITVSCVCIANRRARCIMSQVCLHSQRWWSQKSRMRNAYRAQISSALQHNVALLSILMVDDFRSTSFLRFVIDRVSRS